MHNEQTYLEARVEAEEHMAEAMRILNKQIRHAHKCGLTVKTGVVTMWTAGADVPQIDLWVLPLSTV